MHTIPIISIIHIIHTIHMKCNYHTYHTYNSIHTIAYIQYQPLMPYIPYLPYIPNIPYFPNMPYQTDHTHHTYPPYHTTPPPHHRGGGGQCHTPTTPQGGEGEDLIWDQYMGPIPYGGGRGGWQGLVHIYIYIICKYHQISQSLFFKHHPIKYFFSDWDRLDPPWRIIDQRMGARCPPDGNVSL